MSPRDVMDAPEQLILDLLSSLRAGPRPYAEVMDAWRTSCPKLPVWEDSVDAGLIEHRKDMVSITDVGREWLSAHLGNATLVRGEAKPGQL